MPLVCKPTTASQLLAETHLQSSTPLHHPRKLTLLAGSTPAPLSALALSSLLTYLSSQPALTATYISTLPTLPSIPQNTPLECLDRLFFVRAFDLEGVIETLTECCSSQGADSQHKAVLLDNASTILRAEFLRRGRVGGEKAVSRLIAALRSIASQPSGNSVLVINEAMRERKEGTVAATEIGGSRITGNKGMRNAIGPNLVGEVDRVFWTVDEEGVECAVDRDGQYEGKVWRVEMGKLVE